MSAPAGYTQLPTGEYMKNSDGSGPYVFDGTTMALLATGTGGGGGSSAVTIADGAAVTEGTIADAAVAAGAAGTINAHLRAISRDVVLPLPAGAALIGKVGVDQTTPGTTNAVSLAQIGATTVLTGGVAGSQGIGGLAASGATASGNPVPIAGTFNTTQPTVTTGQAVQFQATARGAQIVATGTDALNVTVNTALPAGAALIGKVGVDQTTPGTTNAVSLAQIGATTVLTGGVAGSQGIGGLAASGATASGNPVPIAGTFNTTQPTVTTGQAVQLQATARGAQIVATGTDALNVTVNTALPAGAALIGKVGVDQTTPGTTNAVSLAQIGATTVVTGGVAGTLGVGGTAAAGATQTGNPLRAGGTARTANPTAVTDGQVSNILTDKVGRLVTVTSQFRDLVGMQTTTITSSTAETTVITAVASTFLDITHLDAVNTSTSATVLTLKDSTAGTTRYTIPLGPGGSASLDFNPPLPQLAGVNNNWTITSSVSVASVYVNTSFVKNI